MKIIRINYAPNPFQNTEQESVLGSSYQFGRWGSGASVKKSDTNKSFTDNNAYAILAQQEDKKSAPPQQQQPMK